MNHRKGAVPAQAAAALRLSAREARAARAAYNRLDQASQFRVCQEIVDTRAHEISLAYRNVVSLAFGYKTHRRTGSAGEEVDYRRPCVIFVVARKWRTPGRSGDPQRLPPSLLTYDGSGGERVLLAVPTDVKPVTAFGTQARPHAEQDEEPPAYGVAVVRPDDPDFAVWGAVACVLERGGEDGLFALSCRHVFSMSLTGPEKASGAAVHAVSTDALVGRTLAVRGPLTDDPGVSFDAQLARVGDADALRDALSGIRFDPARPHARDRSEVPHHFWLLTPRHDARGERVKVWMSVRDYIHKTLPYPGLSVTHRHIMHAVASEPLLPGDSGSPAVPVVAGKTLLGMYIGGDGTHAYIIPAWQLVRGERYGRAAEPLWTVVNP